MISLIIKILKNMFTIIYFLLFHYSFSLKQFRAFNLLSNNAVILITDEGIEKYDPELKERNILVSENGLISSDTDINLVSFAQFPLEEGGYIFCRVKSKIYILGNNFFDYNHFSIPEISDKNNLLIIPYNNIEGCSKFIIAFISENKIKLLMYYLYIEKGHGDLLKSISHSIKSEQSNSANVFNEVFSCSLMSSSGYDNKLLACFAPEQQFRSLWAIIINPEDNLNFVSFSNNKINTTGIYTIKSAISPKDNKCLIAFVDY